MTNCRSDQMSLFSVSAEIRKEIERLNEQEPEIESDNWVDWFEEWLDANHRLVEAERN